MNMNTKNSKSLSFGGVIGVQIDSLEKSVSANAEKRVDFVITFLTIGTKTSYPNITTKNHLLCSDVFTGLLKTRKKTKPIQEN